MKSYRLVRCYDWFGVEGEIIKNLPIFNRIRNINPTSCFKARHWALPKLVTPILTQKKKPTSFHSKSALPIFRGSRQSWCQNKADDSFFTSGNFLKNTILTDLSKTLLVNTLAVAMVTYEHDKVINLISKCTWLNQEPGNTWLNTSIIIWILNSDWSVTTVCLNNNPYIPYLNNYSRNRHLLKSNLCT